MEFYARFFSYALLQVHRHDPAIGHFCHYSVKSILQNPPGPSAFGEIPEALKAALNMIGACPGLDFGLAVRLKDTILGMFTSIHYLWMEPVNNESECMLRKVVIHCKIRQKLVTAGGKAMFSTIMTFLLTWDKRGLNWFEKLSEVFWAT